MSKKFKAGDRVYHKHLKQFGTFVKYAWSADTECFVEFEEEDGYTECKHVTVYQLEGKCKHIRDDGICLKGASSSGMCQFPVCSYYEDSSWKE